MITKKDYNLLSLDFTIPISTIMAIQEVESSGAGFDPVTGKIKIQFEPHWFKRFTRLIINNGVENQPKEWIAFNKAFAKNPDKAMQSTSWGSMQVMGFNFKRLGFKSVGNMVDFAKKSEANQLWLGLKFIQTDKRLFKAVLDKDWKTVARLYNGPLYWKKKYDVKLRNAELKFR